MADLLQRLTSHVTASPKELAITGEEELGAVPRPPSLREVAALAGVSTSTVSNVINGRLNRMGAATRDRVRGAMEQLGYTPNQLARQLRTGQVHAVGLIVPSVANPFWGFVARGVESAAHERGYQVLLCNSERDPGRESEYVETLLQSGIRGLILASSPVSLDHLIAFQSRGLKVVSLDRTSAVANPIVGSVGIDSVLAARLAISHLTGLGHRRIAFVSGPIRTASRKQRLAGYRGALRDAGIEPDPELIWEGRSVASFGDAEGAELGRLAAHQLLSSPKRPTALFTINDMYAMGAYAGARDLGLDIPGDVSIVGFDDIPVLAEVLTPPLTTIRQPLDQMLTIATNQLISKLEGEPHNGDHHITLAPKLIVRASTAVPSHGAQ